MLSPAASGDPDVRSLSPGETRVMELASRGLTNRQAAAELGLSVHAIKFHLSSVYRKLGVANRTEASRLYLLSHPTIPTDRGA
jgi:DNA-binding CsgD family transcriptional regulator